MNYFVTLPLFVGTFPHVFCCCSHCTSGCNILRSRVGGRCRGFCCRVVARCSWVFGGCSCWVVGSCSRVVSSCRSWILGSRSCSRIFGCRSCCSSGHTFSIITITVGFIWTHVGLHSSTVCSRVAHFCIHCGSLNLYSSLRLIFVVIIVIIVIFIIIVIVVVIIATIWLPRVVVRVSIRFKIISLAKIGRVVIFCAILPKSDGQKSIESFEHNFCHIGTIWQNFLPDPSCWLPDHFFDVFFDFVGDLPRFRLVGHSTLRQKSDNTIVKRNEVIIGEKIQFFEIVFVRVKILFLQ